MAACPTGNPIVDAVVGFFKFLGNPIGTIVEGIANAVLAGAIAVFGALTTSIPTLAGTTTAQQVNGETQWLVVYLAVGSLIFAATRMAVERRGNAGITALKGILRVVFVAGAATTVVGAAASLSDRYADYLFQAGAQNQLNNISCSSGDVGSSFLLLVLAFLLLIAGIIHTILLYIRLGVMIVLLGTLPLAAAASMTDWGGGWWRKHIGWMIAWLLYKPAAGLVMYAGSAMITAGGENSINERIAGIGVMLLSAVALPALLKLVVPATAALGGASAMSGAMSSVGGALASGAKSVGGSGGSSGSAGPAGAAGSAGGAGSGGSSGSGGKSGPSGATPLSGGGGGAGAAGAGASGAGAAGGGAAAAGAAAGPVGAAIGAAVSVAQVAGRVASGSLDGADGDAGHN